MLVANNCYQCGHLVVDHVWGGDDQMVCTIEVPKSIRRVVPCPCTIASKELHGTIPSHRS